MEIHRFIAMRFTRYRSSITVQTLPCDSSFTLSIHRYAFTDVFKQVGWSVEVLPCGEARKVGVRLIYCVFFFYLLQEEFTTLEEKASNVLRDYEKAQVSCNVKLDAPLLSFPLC